MEGYLNELLKPIRDELETPEMKQLVAKAYPQKKSMPLFVFPLNTVCSVQEVCTDNGHM